MSCIDHYITACPFAFTSESEWVQNVGCLPTPYDIISMRVTHGKTWACHDEPTKPCVGVIRFLNAHSLPSSVVDPELVTESTVWSEFVTPLSQETLSKLRNFGEKT